MKYTVAWLPSAEQNLASLWLNAADREMVAAAADTIDAALRQNPLSQGESRAGVERILFEPPLVVVFDVYEADRRVSVRTVRRYGRLP